MWRCLLVEDSRAYEHERWVCLSNDFSRDRSVRTERKERTKKCQSLSVGVVFLSR
jgi:hypothetical protein